MPFILLLKVKWMLGWSAEEKTNIYFRMFCIKCLKYLDLVDQKLSKYHLSNKTIGIVFKIGVSSYRPISFWYIFSNLFIVLWRKLLAQNIETSVIWYKSLLYSIFEHMLAKRNLWFYGFKMCDLLTAQR